MTKKRLTILFFSKMNGEEGYARFVAMVRDNLSHMELQKAAEEAVTECIEKNILRFFFWNKKAR